MTPLYLELCASVVPFFLRYDLPARENVAAGNIGRLLDDEAIWEACRKGNATELVEGLPDQLDQMLGRRFEDGVELSGGEWQRIALARAYMRDAQVFVLDEPSAALDPVAESEVFQSFADLSQGRMALFISQSLLHGSHGGQNRGSFEGVRTRGRITC